MSNRYFTLVFLAFAALFAASCGKDIPSGEPKVKILSSDEIFFDKGIGRADLSFVATRDWYIKFEDQSEGDDAGSWISFDKSSGKASDSDVNIEVTVLPNQGADRSGTITVYISNGWGYLCRSVSVSQSGSGDPLVFSNDFDKTEAVKGSSWEDLKTTNLDNIRNEKGSGAAGVSYASTAKISVRSSSPVSKKGDNSVYDGSGTNKVFFGTVAAPATSNAFTILDIALPESTGFKLSFGAGRSVYNTVPGQGKSVFATSDFKVYVSADKAKWAPLTYTFAAGKSPDGVFDRASAVFSVPSGTTTLSICFLCTKASEYSIDDVKLVTSTEAGQAVNLQSGSAITYGNQL